MKLFLRRLLLFIILLILATTILLGVLVQQVNKKECFVLKPGLVETVFLGFSHVQCNINDSLIPHARNLGDAAEPFFYTFQKAKRIFESNPEIQNVFIEFSSKCISNYMDSTIFSDYHMPQFLPRYATVLDGEDYRLLLRLNASQLLSTLSAVPRETLLAYRNRHQDIMQAKKWGGFVYQTESTVAKRLERIRKGFPRPALSNDTTKYNLIYLQKLVLLCQEKGKRIWFFSSPLHAQSGDRSNEALFNEIRETRFSTIPYLDFRDLYFPDEQYRDFEHLNGRGARRFSIFLNQLIRDPAIRQPGNYQQLIYKTWIASQAD
ncbi:MAG: hypothetical protein ACTHMC_17585 [Pseudobacter sp.]|uniref:hypothetical protein n=1 Tax=Pseudobacter sp. TaxID=2045420 RepID=UPI003F7F69D4